MTLLGRGRKFLHDEAIAVLGDVERLRDLGGHKEEVSKQLLVLLGRVANTSKRSLRNHKHVDWGLQEV
jgi:hypothetical protein